MGESYGGHYVPETVAAIQAGNAALAPSAPERINIKGFAVGNGYTDWFLDFNANVPNTRYHALTSQSLLDAADVACNRMPVASGSDRTSSARRHAARPSIAQRRSLGTARSTFTTSTWTCASRASNG